MRTISTLLGITGVIALCVLSFNYVEEHESTKVKKELAAYKLELEQVSQHAGNMREDKNSAEFKLKQACSLLTAAAVFTAGLCDESEAELEFQVCEVCGTRWGAGDEPCPRCCDAESEDNR